MYPLPNAVLHTQSWCSVGKDSCYAKIERSILSLYIVLIVGVMPRHFPDQSTAAQVLVHVDYPQGQGYSDDTMIKGATPGYKFQSRGRREVYQQMKEREPLRSGFGAFLSETEALGKVGDTVRKHFDEVSGVEAQWRSSVHAVPAVTRDSKLQGKKFGHPPPTGAGAEFSDIPRGMKHIEAPKGHLADEMPVFDTVRGRVFTKEGYNKSNLQSIQQDQPTASISDHGERRHGGEGNRNGVPMRNPGDKHIAAVELSPQFFASQRDRLGLEAPAKASVRQNTFAEKETKLAVERDRADVMNLPKYPKPNGGATNNSHGGVAPPPASNTAPHGLPPVGKK